MGRGLISLAAALVAAVADRRAPRADATGTARTPHPTTGTGSRP
ncbi:hypothetical protein ACE6JH_13680 [Streptomyces nigra]